MKNSGAFFFPTGLIFCILGEQGKNLLLKERDKPFLCTSVGVFVPLGAGIDLRCRDLILQFCKLHHKKTADGSYLNMWLTHCHPREFWQLRNYLSFREWHRLVKY